MFSADKPIQKKDYDLLNRTKFSKQLAKAIISYTETDNFTISLCGRWGTGKTSVLNMVIEEINELTCKYSEEEKPIIVSFNPWNYSDQAQLTTQFFKTIMSTLGKNPKNKNLKKIGDALQNYSNILDYAAYIPVAGEYIKLGKSIVSGAGKAISGKASEKESLETRKEEVSKVLQEQKQKLIVVIDDIDRLTNTQIRLIFQLVNSLAGFPNMIYLLSFDKSVVVRALSEEQKCNGEEYLEKIIQVPFEIPEANKKLIDDAFCNKIADIILPGADQDTTFNIEYWQRIFPSCISPFVNTMRDVNRIINTYKFKFGLMREETNCIDLLAITTLQICATEIYNWIFNNTSLLTGSTMSTNGISINEQKANAEKYLTEFKEIYAKNPHLMLQVIQNLFPKFSWNTGGYSHDHDDELTLKHNQKLASSDRINRYFNLSLEDIVIDKKQLLQTINNYDSEQLRKYFESLTKNDTLYDYLSELIAFVSDIPYNRRFMFIEELTELRTKEENRQRRGFLLPTIEIKASNCVFEIFKINDKKENYQNLTNWIKNVNIKTLPYVCEIVVSLERGYGRIGNSTYSHHKYIEENNIETIEKEILEKIKELSVQSCLFDIEEVQIIHLLWNFLDKKSLDDYTKELLKKDENIPKYLWQIASYWHGSDSTDGWTFDEKSFEDYISMEDAFSRISNLKNTKEFSCLAKRFQQITIAFYLWHQRDNEERIHITKNEINSIIPSWEYAEK